MNVRGWIMGAVAVAAMACNGGELPPPKGPDAAEPQPTAATDETSASELPGPQLELIEPVEGGMTVEGVKKFCDDNLTIARQIIEAIRSQDPEKPETLSWESTLGRLDDAFLSIYNGSEFPYLMGVTHPKEAVRDAARACESKTDELMTSIFLDAELADVVKAYAKKGESLSPERKRFLKHTLRDFRRNGIELPAEKQKRLRAINQKITDLGQRFIAEIGSTRGTIEVPPGKLAGLSEAYRKEHQPGPNGKVTITTDYPDFYPFAKYALDRNAAKKLYVKFVNRGGEQNVGRLEKLLKLRWEKAKMLGYDTWADYAIEPRMAKTADNVRSFLERLSTAIAPAVEEDLETFRTTFDRLGFEGRPMFPSDRYFLTELIKERKHQLDGKELAKYFEIGRVTEGLFDITERMYGLEYVEVDVPTWHPEVTAYDVYPTDAAQTPETKIGRFYLDLKPRDHKYKHAAMFTIRTPKKLSSGAVQKPIASLVCNFPAPGQPMPHDQVVTYFHEFGHVLHHLLTETELASFAGTNTVRDFVETPSQMFEEWAWTKDVLDTFTEHVETGEPLPESLFDKLVASRRVGLALATERQLYLARLDLAYHTTPPGFDTTELLQTIHEENFSFRYLPGTHFQSSFSHLIGYDAAYYGYQWALARAHDVLDAFEEQGLFDPGVAKRWREIVLSKGGSVDPNDMLTAFLGREPSERAYVEFLKGPEDSRVGPRGGER